MTTGQGRPRVESTDSERQRSLSTDGLLSLKKSDRRDNREAPVRRRLSVSTTGDPRPGPSPAKRASTQQAPRQKKTNRLLAGNLSTRPASIVQLASDETRLTLAQLVEFGRWGKSTRDHKLDARRPTYDYDETARSEIEGGRPDRREDPGASEVRGGQDSRPPRDRTLSPANQGVTG